MQLFLWASKWGVPSQAIEELKELYGINITNSGRNDTETTVSNMVKLEASQKGMRLWRNNVGAINTGGSFIRFGLANESSSINKKIKSADLIGIRPIKISQKHMGVTIGQFVSREIKSSQWRFTANERELAQLAWAELISSFGGDACFATSEGTL